MTLCLSPKRWLAFITLLASIGASAQEHFRIDPAHTYSTFEYDHWGLSLQHGRFDSNTGSITLDPVTKAGVIEIDIGAASIDTGNAVFDSILRSPEFFDAANYPIISFRSSQIRFEGERLKEVEGVLTIKGIARTVTLTMQRFDCRFMLAYGKRTCGANGSAQLSRSDFDLGKYVPFVSDKVTLYVSVEAIHE